MKILYVAMAHDYGRPELGPSFEEMNFRSALEGMGHHVIPYDFKARETEIGQPAMNRELIELSGGQRPDLVFFFLFEDEVLPDTIRAAGRAGAAVTMNWFADDHWRFDSFSRRYAPALDWVITTDHDAVRRYDALGHHRVIVSQWACNRYAYRHVDAPLEHGVTFVGLPHGNRREVVARLAAAGHPVECFGNGWPSGRIGHEEMVRVFSTSAINLNLSNSSSPPRTLRARIGRRLGRGESGPRPPQIKGRNFEVPGCGGFLLTERVPHLESYFEIGREIVVYDGVDDLIAQVRWWLECPEARAQVAEAGERRVAAEHTYDHRFADIFRRAGLG